MCATCGCDTDDAVKYLMPGEVASAHHHHDHHHDHHHHDHDHHHSHDHTVIDLERDILTKNNLMAERNRGYLEAKNILTINLVSSPGSGKTTLLEKTIKLLKDEIPIMVIEGDQQTTNDADRINATGAKVMQVNTGKGCHLDADMVQHAMKHLQPKENSILFIENVGNLVCPSMFDLGETKRVVIMSTTEGEDKPIKYPTMFETSDICVINKTDLLPYLDFDLEKAKEYALRVNHHLTFFEVSATKESGLDAWVAWLKHELAHVTITPHTH
ncbi:hydrogenase nickel incorporation protein HypB [Fulvivirga sedimenti]|uniref:Hydrogenase nickel incorporation protein HypB n=1 Tax=Fulvivirga sedimenti TaxID=2879465 RepID=A0A9X1HYT2_9BACT|nr:hydrogenase nickel incorporation protein HypB [Fulvivirga sedimenti]MCA6079197.1 hydrogenase nickel incorporation protein HypB [Fulvivirga sedimenti]